MKTVTKRNMQDRICPRCGQRRLVVQVNSRKVLRCEACGWARELKRSRR